MRSRGSLGTADEYWLRYHDDAMSAELGDGVYALTPLTEPGRYGTGAAFEYDADDWGLATYRERDRFNARGMEQTALDAHYRPTHDTRLDATLLDITNGALPGTIYSLRSQTRWSAGLSTDVEWGDSEGDGERGQALRANLYGSTGPLRYYATGWRADSAYRGYLRDKKYLSTGFDLPRRAGWGLRGYYRLQDWNLEPPSDFVLDPQRSPNVQDLIQFAPTERQASLGTEHALGPASRFTLDLTQRTRTDGHSVPQIDTTNRSVRLGFTRSVRSLSFLYALERGITRNDISDRRFDTALHLLTASWQASPGQTYGLYAFRDDNAFSNERQPVETSYGLSASYALGATTSLSLNAQRNDAHTSRGSLYNVALFHERPDGGRFSLVGRRIEGRQAQTDLLLTYSAPFAVPVARKDDVGSVRGRVFDSETGAGLANIVLNLDGLTAVTDREGDFEFPVVKASAYRLSMDRANVDVGKVPVDDLPRDVSVVAREQQDVQIALVRTVTLGAVVTRPPSSPGRADEAAAASEHSGVQNVLVTLRHGEAVYRRLTDADGRIQLAGLTPGAWSVTLAPDTLPAGYVAAEGERRVELAPGATAAVAFELAPLARDIRMLPPLEVR